MINIKDLSFTYPGAKKPALRGVNVEIPDGELCLVIGSSGSGKSTLLRCINGLVPHFSGGSIHGSIRVNELDPVRLSPREMSHMVGFVFQDPEAQFVVDRVEDEIAFSLENAALPEREMDARLEEALALLELESLRSRRLETLSGGEKQRVAIAAALALRPQILVLDEPTSQLDPLGAEELLQSLTNLNKQLGLTIVLAEHRMERVLPYCAQIIYLSEDLPGSLVGPPRDILDQVTLCPPLIVLGRELGWKPLPLTVEEAQPFARQTLSHGHAQDSDYSSIQPELKRDPANGFIRASGVQVSFGSQQVLRGVDINVYPGEITVLMGPNGSGKTTLLRTLIGLLPVQAGEIMVDGKDIKGRTVAEICQQVGYLPQDPNALLFADTVGEELMVTLRNHNLFGSGAVENASHLLDRLGLGNKINGYPRDLSTGERQRVAMGAVMITHPGALLLDEPTRGLDYSAKRTLLELLHDWSADGMAILMVTHDVELAAQVADRIILLEDGLITADGSPHEVLDMSPVFSPQMAKLFPGCRWLTVEDVIGGLNAS
jgi:energy-coupling factor transport system ATP-binding protein